MRKHWFVHVLIVFALAYWASSASAISSPQTLSLLEVSTENSQQPIGDFTFNRAPVGGDQVAIANTLYKWAGTRRGAQVGHDQVLITFITGFGSDFSQTATVLFAAQMYLPGGTILVQGYGHINPNGPSQQTVPVVGGTGTYANARGYLKARDIGNGQSNKTAFEFHLLP
jgi:hypothetical protein